VKGTKILEKRLSGEECRYEKGGEETNTNK